MKWEYFGVTILFVAIGYLIGSISWATILSTKLKKEDIRDFGSKNAGATNTLRNYGPLMALAVFILDVLKPVIAIAIAFLVKTYGGNPWNGILVQAAGIATIIGHIFPVFFKFKGGKGAASLAGLTLAMQWILFFIGFILFVIIVKITKKVSLGALLGSFLLIIFNIGFGFINEMNQDWSNPMTQDPYWWVNTIVLSLAWLLVLYRHKDNIKRLLNGTERVLGKNNN